MLATGLPPPKSPDDLVLTSEAVGCHADATGARVCDRRVELRMTVHHVPAGAGSIELDDARAQLEAGLANIVAPSGPCPGKMTEGKCLSDADVAMQMATGLLAYQNIRGRLELCRLEVDCAGVIPPCLLQASGGFDLTATGPQAAAMQITAGTLEAADQRRPPGSCTQ